MQIGVVLERREIDHPWQSVSWRAVAVLPGAPEIDEARLLRDGPGWARYHAATLELQLHRSDTEGYKHNVTNEEVPMVYVVLRFDDDEEGDEDSEGGDGDEGAPRPFLVTACPYEASVYLDTTATGEVVEPVPMPEAVRAWVQDFVAKHHVDVPFVKKRKKKSFEQHERAQERSQERVQEHAHWLSPAARAKQRNE